MRLKKLQEKVKEQQEKVGEKVSFILCLNIGVFHQHLFSLGLLTSRVSSNFYG
jgi:hypothetical protein